MTARVPDATRRAILKRGAVGAVGVAAAAAIVASGPAGKNAIAAPGTERTIRFLGRGWHTDTKGTLPDKGERYGVYGELLHPSGEKAGEFYAMAVGIDSPFQLTGAGLGALEIHTLTLAEGTIVGVGAGGGLERTYAIVGGTGKYAGARGSYVARQETYGLGGGGKAELLLTLRD
jgi:hypothetical protein